MYNIKLAKAFPWPSGQMYIFLSCMLHVAAVQLSRKQFCRQAFNLLLANTKKSIVGGPQPCLNLISGRKRLPKCTIEIVFNGQKVN